MLSVKYTLAMQSPKRFVWNAWLLLVLALALVEACAAQKLAITMDDLPLNGTLPPGVTRAQMARRR